MLSIRQLIFIKGFPYNTSNIGRNLQDRPIQTSLNGGTILNMLGLVEKINIQTLSRRHFPKHSDCSCVFLLI